MDRAPSLWYLKDLYDEVTNGPRTCVKGHWVPERPLSFHSLRRRFRFAWMVFKGEADAVVWPEDEA
jgi:hypothetical protein